MTCISARGKTAVCGDVTSDPLVVRYLAALREITGIRSELQKQAERASERIRSIKNDSLISVGLYFEGSYYLMASFTGYTHAGLVASPGGVPYLFHRVHGYFFAEPLSGLTATLPVEAVSLSRPHMSYGLIRRTIRPPFHVGRGILSDSVTLTNIYVDLKHHLPLGTSLAPGFVFGAAHLLVHLPHNAPVFRSIRKVRTFRDFQYYAYDLEGLKGKSVDLIVVCSGTTGQ